MAVSFSGIWAESIGSGTGPGGPLRAGEIRVQWKGLGRRLLNAALRWSARQSGAAAALPYQATAYPPTHQHALPCASKQVQHPPLLAAQGSFRYLSMIGVVSMKNICTRPPASVSTKVRSQCQRGSRRLKRTSNCRHGRALR